MTYTISPREMRVLLDVFERHVETLTEAEERAMSFDPLDIVKDLKHATIRLVAVVVDESEEQLKRS